MRRPSVILATLLLSVLVLSGLMQTNANAEPAAMPAADLGYTNLQCYTSYDAWCTAYQLSATYVNPCDPGCPSIYAQQNFPSRTCRWRVFYRIPGSGNDWATGGELLNPSTGDVLIGTRVSNASRYDIQIRCGATFSGYAGGWFYVV